MSTTTTMGLTTVAAWASMASLVVAQPPPPGPRQGGAPQIRMQIGRDIEYSRAGGRSLTLDLYRREPAAAPSPVIVWIHDGSSASGGKAPSPAAALTNEGFAVASIEYRAGRDTTFPAQVHDCKAAIRWLRANAARYNLDGAQIGVWGHGVGGYLASLLGTTGDVAALEGDGGHLGAACDLDSLLTLPTLDLVARFFAGLKGPRPSGGLSSLLASPPDAWLDPVSISLGGTLYRTYPTPSRGPRR